MSKILVTGATGNIGQEVVRRLLEARCSIRLGLRDYSKTIPFLKEVECSRLDFRDKTSFAGTLEGCQKIFLIRPPDISDTKNTLCPFVLQALEAGVQHIVFVSVAGAENKSWVPHHAVEKTISENFASYTLLRPGFFMQNIENHYQKDILERDQIFLPSGDGKVAFVDVRDIAEVAVLALLQENPCQEAHTLTGQQSYDFYEVAKLLTQITGREIRYKPVSVFRYAWHLYKQGIQGMQAIVYAFLHLSLRTGNAEKIDLGLPKLLGHEARKLEDYLLENQEKWKTR